MAGLGTTCRNHLVHIAAGELWQDWRKAGQGWDMEGARLGGWWGMDSLEVIVTLS